MKTKLERIQEIIESETAAAKKRIGAQLQPMMESRLRKLRLRYPTILAVRFRTRDWPLLPDSDVYFELEWVDGKPNPELWDDTEFDEFWLECRTAKRFLADMVLKPAPATPPSALFVAAVERYDREPCTTFGSVKSGGEPPLTIDATREELLVWLQWGDPNGAYTDEATERESIEQISLEYARHLVIETVESTCDPAHDGS